MYGLTHNIGTVSFSSQPPTLCRRPGGPQNGSEPFGEDLNLLPLPVIEPRYFGRPARSLVTVLTELSRSYLSAESEDNHRQKARAG